MAKKQKEIELESIKIDSSLLRNIQKIMKDINGRILLKTEVNYSSESEITTYENLEDFLENSMELEKPQSFSMRIYSSKREDRRKTVQLYLRINNKENRNYFQLIGYDGGKMLSCEKSLKSLFEKNKKGYGFIYNLGIIYESLPLILAISLSFISYRIILLLSNLQESSAILISIILALIYGNKSKKIIDNLFPEIDIKIFEKEKDNFWRYAIGAVILGLITYLIIEIVKYIL